MDKLKANIFIEDSNGRVVCKTTVEESAQFETKTGKIEHEFLIHFAVEEDKRG